MRWKIYFLIILFFELFAWYSNITNGKILNFDGPFSAISFVFSEISLLALFLFAFNKRFLPSNLWKFFFACEAILFVISYIQAIYNLFITKTAGEAQSPILLTLALILIGLIWESPRLIALYSLGFQKRNS